MITTKQLKNAAEELIEVLGLVDDVTKKAIAITKKMGDDEIIALIKEAAEEVTPDDEISEETREIIDELLNATKKKATAPAAKGKKVIVPEPEPEDDEDVEEIDEDFEELPTDGPENGVDDEDEDEAPVVPDKKAKKQPVAEKAVAPAKPKKAITPVKEEAPAKESKPAKAAKVAKEKPAKAAKVKKPRERNSAFADALLILGKTPEMPVAELIQKVLAKGYDDTAKNGIRSAHLIMKRAIEHLKQGGHYKA
jgi:hypothetical protein